MKRHPIFFLTIIFLLLGLCISAQTEKDSLVIKGDTTFLFFKNGCLHEKGIWKNNRWVGKYYLYYKNPCGQLWQEFNYDNVGRFISSKEYGKDGNFISIQEYDEKGNLVLRKVELINFFAGDSVKESKRAIFSKEYDEKGNLILRNVVLINYSSEDSAKEYQRVIFSGDSCLANSHFNCAIERYSNALNIKPNDNYAFKQLAKANHDCDSVLRATGWSRFEHTETTLYSNQHIVTKGIFHGCEFINGEQRIYDRDGRLIQIKLYKDGKYVGDAPLPIEEK